MNIQKMSKECLGSIAWGCVILTVGILFCCSLSFGILGLSYVIGTTIIVAGLVLALTTGIKKKSLITINGLLATAIMAFGVMFIMRRLASIVVDFIPWFMISVGVFIIIDAFLLRFARKDRSLFKFILELVFGILSATLGFLVKFVSGWDKYSATVLGIIFIFYALYTIFNAIFNSMQPKNSSI